MKTYWRRQRRANANNNTPRPERTHVSPRPQRFESGRMLQYGYTQDPHANRPVRRRRRHRVLKLMTQEQMDAKFPILNFKQAKEQSPLNHEQHESVTIIENEPQRTRDKEKDDDEDYGDITSIATGAEDAKISAVSVAQEKSSTPKRQSINLLRPFSRLSNSVSPNHGGAGDVRLSFDRASALESQVVSPKSIEVVRTKDEESDDDNENIMMQESPNFNSDNSLSMCAICIDTMEDTDQVRLLTCGHIFHAATCIDPWLTKRQACCPMCKLSLYAPKPEDPLGPEPIEILEARFLEIQRQERLAHAREVRGNHFLVKLVRRLMGRSSTSNTSATTNGSGGATGDSANGETVPATPATAIEADPTSASVPATATPNATDITSTTTVTSTSLTNTSTIIATSALDTTDSTDSASSNATETHRLESFSDASTSVAGTGAISSLPK